jgi:hypothetical protein
LTICTLSTWNFSWRGNLRAEGDGGAWCTIGERVYLTVFQGVKVSYLQDSLVFGGGADAWPESDGAGIAWLGAGASKHKRAVE